MARASLHAAKVANTALGGGANLSNVAKIAQAWRTASETRQNQAVKSTTGSVVELEDQSMPAEVQQVIDMQASPNPSPEADISKQEAVVERKKLPEVVVPRRRALLVGVHYAEIPELRYFVIESLGKVSCF